MPQNSVPGPTLTCFMPEFLAPPGALQARWYGSTGHSFEISELKHFILMFILVKIRQHGSVVISVTGTVIQKVIFLLYD